MKELPQKFLQALCSAINKDTKASQRIVQKIEEDPEGAASKIEHLLGSDTVRLRIDTK